MFKKSVVMLIVFTMLFALSAVSFAEFETDMVKSYIVTESVSGKIVLEKNSSEAMSVAGITRIAPLLMAVEAVDNGLISKEDVITVSREAASLGGVSAFLETDEKIKAELLIKSAVMIGAGDAIYSLCESAYGGEAVFVEKVNERLSNISVSVVYSDIMGSGIKMCAADIAKIGAELIKSKTYLEYSMLFYDTVTHEDGRETELANPNKLVKNYSGCIGGITGSSNEAGYCGVFAVKRNDAVYICTILGSKNSNDRFKTASDIFEYVFAAYRTHQTAKQGDVMAENVEVVCGTKNSVNLIAKNDFTIIFENGTDYEAVLDVPEKLEAPIFKNVSVGKIEYRSSGGELLGTMELCPCEDIERATFWVNVCKIFRCWLHI